VTDRTYNIGTGTETSLVEVAEAMVQTMGSSVSIEYAPPRKVNPVPRRQADTWCAAQELGFQAIVPFEEGLRKLAAWWQTARRENEVPA
jgi:UDP-glucose 4-epimerase